MRRAAAIRKSVLELEKEKQQQVMSIETSDCVSVHADVLWKGSQSESLITREVQALEGCGGGWRGLVFCPAACRKQHDHEKANLDQISLTFCSSTGASGLLCSRTHSLHLLVVVASPMSGCAAAKAQASFLRADEKADRADLRTITAVCTGDPILQAKVKCMLMSLEKWPENDDVKFVQKAAKKRQRELRVTLGRS